MGLTSNQYLNQIIIKVLVEKSSSVLDDNEIGPTNFESLLIVLLDLPDLGESAYSDLQLRVHGNFTCLYSHRLTTPYPNLFCILGSFSDLDLRHQCEFRQPGSSFALKISHTVSSYRNTIKFMQLRTDQIAISFKKQHQ